VRRLAPAFLLFVSCAAPPHPVLEGAQRVMGPLPGPERRVPLDVRVDAEERFDRYVLRRLSYAAEPGDRVPALLLVPLALRGPAPAAICLHQTTAKGKAEPAGGGSPDLAYARELASRGFVALAPDYPNFGDYKVDPYSLGYASATMKGIWNHLRGVDLLASLPEVDPDRIAAVGHSLGGHNAIFLAAFDPRIRAVVTSCGFTAFPKYMKGDLAGWSHKGYMPRIAAGFGKDPARMPFDFPDLLRSLAPRALFVNAPLKDSNFDVDGVRDCVAAAAPLYAALGAADRLVAEYPDAGHAFPAPVRERAWAFLERVLAR
jgi:dienelactone hydrolase